MPSNSDSYYESAKKKLEEAQSKKETSEAWDLIHLSANEGNIDAQMDLGSAYNSGEKGLPLDHTKSFHWYMKAANQGDQFAQFCIGLYYQSPAPGYESKQNLNEAAKWFRKSADQGCITSLMELALIYYNGQGLPMDKSEAVKLWIQVIDLAEIDAQNTFPVYSCVQYIDAYANLAECYFNGHGVRVDKPEAIKWCRKMTERNPDDAVWAQMKLSECYEKGDGVPENIVLAYMWSNIASANGDTKAIEKRQKLAGNMTKEQIAEGQRMSTEIKSTNSK